MRKLLTMLTVATLAVAVTACSDDDGDSETATDDTATEGESTTPTETDDTDDTTDADEEESDETLLGGGTSDDEGATATGDDEFPCDLMTQAQVEEMAGNPLDPGDATTIFVTENDVEWEAQECAWLTFEDGDVDLTVQVTEAEGFPSGSVECPQNVLGESLSGVGDSAQWEWLGGFETSSIGELRVCSAVALVDVRASGPDDEDRLQVATVTLANTVLSAL